MVVHPDKTESSAIAETFLSIKIPKKNENGVGLQTELVRWKAGWCERVEELCWVLSGIFVSFSIGSVDALVDLGRTGEFSNNTLVELQRKG